MYCSTSSRLASFRFTLSLIGSPVSLLTNARISSTERNSSSACFGLIFVSGAVASGGFGGWLAPERRLCLGGAPCG